MLADDVRRAAARRRNHLCSRRRRRRPKPARRLSAPALRRRAAHRRRPGDRAAAMERVREVAAAAAGAAVSGFSLADLEALAARESVTLRALLEELRAAGLELVAEAPFDRLQDPRRSIEEVNIAGLSLARLTVHQLAVRRSAAALEGGRRTAAHRRGHPRVRAAAAPRQSRGADDRLRRRQARRAGAPRRRQRAVHSGRLVAVRAEARAGRAHRRRRRCGRVSADDDTSEGRRRAPLEEIRRNIRAAGQEPVERNGRFDVVLRRRALAVSAPIASGWAPSGI